MSAPPSTHAQPKKAPLTLVAREGNALAPVGAYAVDGAARALIEAALALPDESLARLRGVCAPALDIVVILGAAEHLPWCDGVRYLGEIAPGLLVPTTRALSLPAPLVAAALARHVPAALLPRGLVPLVNALPLHRHTLAARL